MEYLVYNFNEVFDFSNGRITPKQQVRIGSITLGPKASIGSGVAIGGLNITDFVGKDVAVTEEDGILVIHGFYNQPVQTVNH